MTDISLECRCGKIKGVAHDVTPQSGNHIVCCCSDCQRFARFLDKDNQQNVLDEFGGTRIFQTSQSQVSLSEGRENLRCLRLTPKGLYRWYAGCCNTPIGNTMNAKMAFVGLIHNFIGAADNHQSNLGPIRAYVEVRDATSAPNYPFSSEKVSLGILFRIMRKLLVWKIRGMGQPSCFFNQQGKTVVKAKVLQQD